MKTKILYMCEICGTHYTNQAKAEACEAQGPVDFKFAVGDAVWVSGDDEFWDEEKPGVVFRKGNWHSVSEHQPDYEVEILNEQGEVVDLIYKEESELRKREEAPSPEISTLIRCAV